MGHACRYSFGSLWRAAKDTLITEHVHCALGHWTLKSLFTVVLMFIFDFPVNIQLLEYPIPATTAPRHKNVTWRYLGNQAWYHRSASVKTTRKILKKKKKNIESCQKW